MFSNESLLANGNEVLGKVNKQHYILGKAIK